MLRGLQENKAIQKETINTLHNLRELRNEAAHVDDFVVTPKQAFAYVDSAGQVKQSLNECFHEPPDVAGTAE